MAEASESEAQSSADDDGTPDGHVIDEDGDEIEVPVVSRKCPSCNDVFKSHHDWMLHVENNHKPKHDCPVPTCYYRTANKWQMKQHFRQTHGKNAIRCSIEGCQGFFVKRCMKKHLLTAHKPKGEFVGAKMKKIVYECRHCSYKSSKTREFEAHVKDFHVVGFRCNIGECRTTFFADKIHLHFKALHPGRRYKYKLGKGLKVYAENVETDGMTESATEKEDEDLFYLPENSAADNFTCAECKKNFNSRYRLLKHRAAVHEKKYKPAVRAKKFACTFDGCVKTFTTEGLLKDHLNSHNGNYEYSCQYCNQEFFARNRLAVHLKKYHLVSIKQVSPTVFTKVVNSLNEPVGA